RRTRSELSLVPDPRVEGQLSGGVEQISPPALAGERVMHAPNCGQHRLACLDDVRLMERDALHARVYEVVKLLERHRVYVTLSHLRQGRQCEHFVLLRHVPPVSSAPD